MADILYLYQGVRSTYTTWECVIQKKWSKRNNPFIHVVFRRVSPNIAFLLWPTCDCPFSWTSCTKVMKFSGLGEKIMQIPNMAEKFLTNNLLTDDMWFDCVKQVVFHVEWADNSMRDLLNIMGSGIIIGHTICDIRGTKCTLWRLMWHFTHISLPKFIDDGAYSATRGVPERESWEWLNYVQGKFECDSSLHVASSVQTDS